MATSDGTITGDKSVKLRVRFPAGGVAKLALTVTSGHYYDNAAIDILPAKEWCIVDDVGNVSDAASFTVANIDGENADKFYLGQRVQIDESDPDVAGGQWCRQFTGIVIATNSMSDQSGGSIIAVDLMDLGWLLSNCHARPLQGIEGITIDQLISKLVDPSWGFASTSVDENGQAVASVTVGNLLNRKLRQGRQGIVRYWIPPLQKQFLPPIQVEPGQAPWDILQPYLARAGWMLNVDVNGGLVMLQPAYNTSSPYAALEYHGANDAARGRNSVVGRPTLRQSIDGVYSQTECWWTVTKPKNVQQQNISQNPNAQFQRNIYVPPSNPLPFFRRFITNDNEALNDAMAKNRAVYKYQLGVFDSWTYEVDVVGHSSGGAFYASDTLVPVNDTINGVPSGSYYVQSVRKSSTTGEGTRTHLTIKKPGLVNPQLLAQIGGGAAAASKLPQVVK